MAGKLSSIDDLASVQWSLVTRRQLIGSGFSRGRISALLQAGTIRAVRPGVYATLGSMRSWQQDVLAAVLAVGDGAVASHTSAARLWEFAHRPQDGVSVLFEGDCSLGQRGTHRTTILPDDDVTVRSGIPCTSFERTLCDCTKLLSPLQLGRVLDEGLRRGSASLARLERCVARLDSGPGRRLSVAKQLLSERDASFDAGGSASELHVLRVIRDAALPLPAQQHRVEVRGRSYVLDFAWPDRLVFAEYYGLAVHSGASAVAYDSRRMSALVAAGWRGLVFTDTTPDRQIVEDLTSLFAMTPSDGAIEHRMSA